MRVAVRTALWVVLPALLLPVLATPAAAEGAMRQGWWSQAGGGNAATAPPDVPPDGLFVQGGSQGPVALAALLYEIPDGQAPTTLTLALAPAASPSTAPGTPPAVAPAPAPPPALQACTIKSGEFNSEQNGPWQDAPAADCAHGAAGTFDSSARTISFAVGPLASSGSTTGRLAVAIVPTTPTDRVAFTHPGPDSLRLGAADTSAGSGGGGEAASSPPDTGAYAGGGQYASAPTAASAPLSSPSGYQPGAASTGPAAAAPAAAPAPPTGPTAIDQREAVARIRAPVRGWTVRAGELGALALVLAALLAYARGYGLLGGRFAQD